MFEYQMGAALTLLLVALLVQKAKKFTRGRHTQLPGSYPAAIIRFAGEIKSRCSITTGCEAASGQSPKEAPDSLRHSA